MLKSSNPADNTRELKIIVTQVEKEEEKDDMTQRSTLGRIFNSICSWFVTRQYEFVAL